MSAHSRAPRHAVFVNQTGVSFTKITTGSIVTNAAQSWSAAWGDFDNDEFIDLVVGNLGADFLYRNNGNGTFTSVTSSPVVVNNSDFGAGTAFADYDNDGHLDLIVGGAGGPPTQLFRNNGDGTFKKVVGNPPAAAGFADSVTWGDYDNDGYLDLMIALYGSPNLLYRNNGDGSFAQINTGSLANDVAVSFGGIWGDYDNDGFMDLFVANGAFAVRQTSSLYRNNGNTNAWLKLKLIGTGSNRSAIGAKVRVKAAINGKSFWQMREISGGDAGFSQNDIRPNFGLGNAKSVETLRIEWPAGQVQELTNVPANQTLIVQEPPGLEPTVRVNLLNGVVELKVQGWKGFTYAIEASSDLTMWQRLGTAQNLTGTLQVADAATFRPQRFYRVVVP